MKIKCCCSLILCYGPFLTYAMAQTPVDVFTYFIALTEKGSIEIIQDQAIQTCVNAFIQQQQKLNGVKGYQISIYRGSGQASRKEAEWARANFLLRYEKVRCDIQYEPPFFNVYVGDFRTKSQALKFLIEIEPYYPEDAFIIKAFIEFPP